MDRQAITRHLLSDAQDPYNRKPLTVEMLEPNDTLREEIEEWMRQVVSSSFTLFYISIFVLRFFRWFEAFAFGPSTG